MSIPYDVRESGLFRCCLASLADAMQQATAPPREGDHLACDTCLEPLIFDQGAWQWGERRRGATAEMHNEDPGTITVPCDHCRTPVEIPAREEAAELVLCEDCTRLSDDDLGKGSHSRNSAGVGVSSSSLHNSKGGA